MPFTTYGLAKDENDQGDRKESKGLHTQGEIMIEIEFAKTENLQRIVATLCRVVKPTNDYCGFIYFATGKLVATNADVIIEIHLPGILDDVRFPFAVSAEVLKNSIALCGVSTVIRYTEKNDTNLETVKLISGENEFIIPILKDTGPFERLTIVDKDTYKLKVSFDDLTSLIKYASPHIGEANRSYGLNGMHFLSNGEQLRCCGADGATLAWSYAEVIDPVNTESINTDDIKILNGGISIPKDSANIIKDLASIYATFGCELSCDSGRWVMTLKHDKGTGWLKISGSQVELPFPKILSKIKREEPQANSEHVIYVGTKLLDGIIKKVSLFSSDDTKKVKINLNHKDATIRVSSYGKGRADVIVPIEKLSFTSVDFEMDFNPIHMLACLGNIKTENVQIRCDISKHRVFIFDDNAIPNPSTGMLLALLIPAKKAVTA